MLQTKKEISTVFPVQLGIVQLALAWRIQKPPRENIAFITEHVTSYLNHAKKDKQSQHYFLGDRYPGVYFTDQEARCMFYFLKGANRRTIGKILHILPNTVTYYTKRMRRKLGCDSKKALVLCVKETDFMDEVDALGDEENKKLKYRKKLVALVEKL